jgi:hypothetical protein
MFENVKTGFVYNKLIKLGYYIQEFNKGKYGDSISYIIPNIQESINTYRSYFSGTKEYKQYVFCIGNIAYGVELDKNFVFIKVEDIVIFHNRDDHTDSGHFEDVYRGWNHTAPKAMLNKIKEDSKIIDKYNKLIKEYMKSHSTIEKTKWMQEQEELNEIFK